MGAEPTGVHVVVSTEYQVAVVSVAGEVATTAQAHEVADRLLDVEIGRASCRERV